MSFNVIATSTSIRFEYSVNVIQKRRVCVTLCITPASEVNTIIINMALCFAGKLSQIVFLLLNVTIRTAQCNKLAPEPLSTSEIFQYIVFKVFQGGGSFDLSSGTGIINL